MATIDISNRVRKLPIIQYGGREGSIWGKVSTFQILNGVRVSLFEFSSFKLNQKVLSFFYPEVTLSHFLIPSQKIFPIVIVFGDLFPYPLHLKNFIYPIDVVNDWH